jgi:hypothetical protein
MNNFKTKLLTVGLWVSLSVVPGFPTDINNVIPSGNWNGVESLQKLTSISMHMDSGDKIEGKFLALDSDSIRLNVDKQEKIFPRQSIVEIRQTRMPDRKINGILIGMGVGGLSGGLVANAAGAIKTGDSAARSLGGAMIMAGVGFGALFGGLIDSRIKGSKLIYRK